MKKLISLLLLLITVSIVNSQTIVDYAIQTVTHTPVQPLTTTTTTNNTNTRNTSNVTNNIYTYPMWWNNWNYYTWNTTNTYQQPVVIYPIPSPFVNYNASNSYITR